MSKVSPLCLVLCALPFLLPAQARWEVGFHLGGNNYLGDLTYDGVPVMRETQFGFGFFGKRQFTNQLGLRLNYHGGQVSGDDNRFDERADRGMSFRTPLHEVSLLAEWQFNASNRYSKGAVHQIATPYLFLGPGASFYKPDTDYNENSGENTMFDARDLESQQWNTAFSLNTGAGIRFDLSERTSLGFEVSVHPLFSDWLDGVRYSGNPDNNDWYMFYGMSLGHRLALYDKDKDGITDACDVCPDQPGKSKFFGCPDSDDDGITDALDACPTLAGSPFYRGCPDTDGDGTADNIDECPDIKGPGQSKGCPDADLDGVPDHKDACPDVAGRAALDGCPDADADGIPDHLDRCPGVFGPATFNGCPDSDGDGVPDHLDNCPRLAGLSMYGGCPFVDTDGDGIADDEDKCPELKGVAAGKGCPDSDGDGVFDADDRCPDVKGVLGGKGCPEVKKEDREAIALAVRSVQFEFGSDQLTAYSQKLLDKVADVLRRYPEQHVQITGHTDSKGSDAFNLKLSERRAARCRQYLIDKGIAADKLTSKGFGESKPIASNATAKGQAKNRRVEFDLSVK